ncbi:beta-glucosidase 12-like, partial [Olea europaea subsp. europaea]
VSDFLRDDSDTGGSIGSLELIRSPSLSQFSTLSPSLTALSITTFTDSITTQTGVSSFYVYPRGLRDLLDYTKQKYKNPTIYIMENVKHGTNDPQREIFYHRHLLAITEAIEDDGVNVKGFFPWSLLDNYEWGSGYTQKFETSGGPGKCNGAGENRESPDLCTDETKDPRVEAPELESIAASPMPFLDAKGAMSPPS